MPTVQSAPRSARPIEIFQGEDATIVVQTRESLVSATEIEFAIDTPTQILKTLTGGQISGVTATQFSVAIAAADTQSVCAGEYPMQYRSTISGAKANGKLRPDAVRIRDSVFVNPGLYGNDYGNR